MLLMNTNELPRQYSKMVEQLYSEYKPMMFCIAMDIVKNKEHAFDIVHSSFESIMKHIRKLSVMSENEKKGFIILTVKNKALDLLNLHENKKTVPLDSFMNHLPDEYNSAEKEAILNIETDDIMVLFEKLERKYSVPVFHKYVLGYSMTEVAKLLDITVPNAKVRCFRGRSMLLELMKAGESDE